ncbi:hypothetical protein BDR07DRAFT_1488711 [Suillus spraguei]|nr:hypothetical protein BDR07DRAFT_1488711 [Suillus spraguei]
MLGLTSSSLGSRTSEFLSATPFSNRPRRPSSTPPTSSSSPLKFTSPVLPNPVDPKIADDDLFPHNEASCKISTTESPAGHHRPKRSRAEYTLSQVGDRDEDLDLPSKRLKTLQTTWNCTGLPSETSAYFNGRMLELSRVTRQAITARLQYQRIRYHELDLIKSILHDENELAQTQLIAIDTQISSLQNTLEDGGVPIEKTGSKGPGCMCRNSWAWCETYKGLEALESNSVVESDSVVPGCAEDE